MGTFIYILFIFLGLFEFIWYLTCTNHKKVPLILVLLDALLIFCPILNIFIAFGNIFFLVTLVGDCEIELKDNWFNRTFLAYNAE